MDDSLEKVQEITRLLDSLDEDALKRIPRDVLLEFSASVSTWFHKAIDERFKGFSVIGPCPNGIWGDREQSKEQG